MDLYSTAGCEFMHVNVGFQPSNEAWNQTSADVGLFFYQSNDFSNENRYKEMIHSGCQNYADDFNEYFIKGDRTWSVAKIMAYISGSAGILGTVTAWLIVITPLPSWFFWPGVLLPSVLIIFLAGGAKFLFFDTEICHSRLWVPFSENNEYTPQKAEECRLGRDGYVSIVSCGVALFNIFLVCLKAPKKRELSNYGLYYNDVEGDSEELRADDDWGRSDIEAPMKVSKGSSKNGMEVKVKHLENENDDLKANENSKNNFYYFKDKNEDPLYPDKKSKDPKKTGELSSQSSQSTKEKRNYLFSMKQDNTEALRVAEKSIDQFENESFVNESKLLEVHGNDLDEGMMLDDSEVSISMDNEQLKEHPDRISPTTIVEEENENGTNTVAKFESTVQETSSEYSPVIPDADRFSSEAELAEIPRTEKDINEKMDANKCQEDDVDLIDKCMKELQQSFS